MITGDFADDTGINWFLENIGKYQIEYNLVLGNHDVYSTYKNVHKPMNDSPYYCFTKENHLFMFLDTSTGSIDTVQYKWIKDEIDNCDLPIIVFMHHPLLISNNYFMEMNHALNNRDKLIDIFLDLQRRIVIFCGHYHMDDKTEKKNTVQYVTSPAFFQFDKSAVELQIGSTIPGYRIITIKNEDYTTNVKYIKKKSNNCFNG